MLDVKNLPIIIFTVTGIGTSNTYIASSEILALNFERFKYLAFSLAVLGYYAGMAEFAIISQKLLDLFGYSKALGILASFHVIHIVAGFMFFQSSQTSACLGRYVIYFHMNEYAKRKQAKR